MKLQSFTNVWDALTDSPADSANMTLRSDLLIVLQQTVTGWGLTQAETVRRLGITQPRLTDLLGGKVAEFSLDALVNLATEAGLSVELRTSRAA